MTREMFDVGMHGEQIRRSSREELETLAKEIMESCLNVLEADFQGPWPYLPSWLPMWHRQQFYDVLFDLLERHNPNTVKNLLSMEIAPGQHPRARWVSGRVFRKVEQILVPRDSLLLVKQLAQLIFRIEAGPEQSLEYLGGKGAAQGYRSRLAGKENLRKRHLSGSHGAKGSILDELIRAQILEGTWDSNSASKLAARYQSMSDERHKMLLEGGQPGLRDADRRISSRQVRNRKLAIASALLASGEISESEHRLLAKQKKWKS